MRQLILYTLLFVVLASGSVRSTSAQQSRATFEKATAKQSTAPSYVLVTIINDKTKTRQTICTTANFLEGAIHDQYHIPYTSEGIQEEREILLANRHQTFHFSQSNALENLAVPYTPQILAEVRDSLRKVSTTDLVKGMVRNGKLHRIYEKQKSFRRFAAYRDALAYVLLERGLRPGQGDVSGGLYLSP